MDACLGLLTATAFGGYIEAVQKRDNLSAREESESKNLLGRTICLLPYIAMSAFHTANRLHMVGLGVLGLGALLPSLIFYRDGESKELDRAARTISVITKVVNIAVAAIAFSNAAPVSGFALYAGIIPLGAITTGITILSIAELLKTSDN